MTKSSELFIVDNTDGDWKVLNYLKDFCSLSAQIDIATGFFEIGSLLALDGEYQRNGHRPPDCVLPSTD